MIKFNDLVLSMWAWWRPEETTRLDDLKAIVNSGPQIKPPRVIYATAKHAEKKGCQCVVCKGRRAMRPPSKALLAMIHPGRSQKS